MTENPVGRSEVLRFLIENPGWHNPSDYSMESWDPDSGISYDSYRNYIYKAMARIHDDGEADKFTSMGRTYYRAKTSEGST